MGVSNSRLTEFNIFLLRYLSHKETQHEENETGKTDKQIKEIGQKGISVNPLRIIRTLTRKPMVCIMVVIDQDP